MVVILVALTFFVRIIARGVAKSARSRVALRAEVQRSQGHLFPAQAVNHSGRVLQFPEDVYYQMGHAWVKVEEGNRIRVGLHDSTKRGSGILTASRFLLQAAH